MGRVMGGMGRVVGGMGRVTGGMVGMDVGSGGKMISGCGRGLGRCVVVRVRGGTGVTRGVMDFSLSFSKSEISSSMIGLAVDF